MQPVGQAGHHQVLLQNGFKTDAKWATGCTKIQTSYFQFSLFLMHDTLHNDQRRVEKTQHEQQRQDG